MTPIALVDFLGGHLGNPPLSFDVWRLLTRLLVRRPRTVPRGKISASKAVALTIQVYTATSQTCQSVIV